MQGETPKLKSTKLSQRSATQGTRTPTDQNSFHRNNGIHTIYRSRVFKMKTARRHFLPVLQNSVLFIFIYRITDLKLL